MDLNEALDAIKHGQTCLGIELGSTRIKAVLIDDEGRSLAAGEYAWENKLEGGIWTYSMDEVWTGLQSCYAALTRDVFARYGLRLETVGAIGLSGMMHGYLPFDKAGGLLTPFRTWRNTITGEAAARLTELFNFNIPQRWSIAHIYQAMLNNEAHVKDLDYVTSLAGYIHLRLTGERVVGVGEASGMFPVDGVSLDYDAGMTEKFDALVSAAGYGWRLRDVMPRVKLAGENAGVLTAQGAGLLDPSGTLRPGIPLAPPEGDAGTGMVATNSVEARTGNVSAGTSVFLLAVLEKPLSRVYPEIDIITTPSGAPVAMVHANTCTSELNAWVNLFAEALETLGQAVEPERLFAALFNKALTGDADCGGLLAYNYLAGEPVTGFETGRPLFLRSGDSRFTLANFMRAQLYSCVATLKIGMRILEGEALKIDGMLGHGGFFKTERVGQLVMSAALNAPVSVMETAGEGGPWGMALLTAYMKNKTESETLEAYLSEKIFKNVKSQTLMADKETKAGFDAFMERYERCLAVERAAVLNS